MILIPFLRSIKYVARGECMILSQKEQLLIAFFSANSDKYLDYDEQKIFQNERSYKRTVRKLERLDILKSKLIENNSHGKKIYTIKRTAEYFGECIRKIVEAK
jgi:hypothetical protein